MNEGQVITIVGKTSEWYDKAIFVLKKEVNQSCINKDLCQEAEKIISDYAKKNGLAVANNRAIDRTLNFILFTTICILAVCLLQL